MKEIRKRGIFKIAISIFIIIIGGTTVRIFPNLSGLVVFMSEISKWR